MFSASVASVIAPQLSVARIVIVCEPYGVALLIETTPDEFTLIVPVYVPCDWTTIEAIEPVVGWASGRVDRC